MPPCNPSTLWGRAFLLVRLAEAVDTIARERGEAARKAVAARRKFWHDADHALVLALVGPHE